jgi:DNA polymerase type B, organellar and viral
MNLIKHPFRSKKIKHYKNIVSAYFRDRVEVFKPYGEDLYLYDVGSLYHSIMLKDIPIGPFKKIFNRY